MKRNTRITIAACLLAVVLGAGAGVAVKRWPHTVPLEECSEVYRRYRDTPGIRAAFVKDMAIEDTIRFDMAILQATDTNAYFQLLRDLGHSEGNIEDMRHFMETGEEYLFVGIYKDEISCNSPDRITVSIIHPHRPQDKETLILRSVHRQIKTTL